MTKLKRLSLKTKIFLSILALVIILMLILGGIYWYSISRFFGRTYEPDLVISSPEGQHELVIREFACLGGAGAEIYIREPGQNKWYNSWMMKQVGRTGTDNYCQPFTDGRYYVSWESNQVTICYYRGLRVENANDQATWRGKGIYELE